MRSLRDSETASGAQPGAESRVGGDNGAPTGIVRLSDFFRAEDFTADRPERARLLEQSDAGRERSHKSPRGGRLRRSKATVPAVAPPSSQDRGPAPTIRSRAGSGVDDYTVASSVQGPHARQWLGKGTRARPDAEVRPAAASTPVCEEGPAYESLFSGRGSTERRQRREREPATALARALGLLTRREHSRKELTRKLVTRGLDVAEVDAAVDKLTGAGWQDDQRFAESLVRVRAANGYGPLHIRAELGTHDLPEALREAALEAFEGDWAAIARDAVSRRFERIEDMRLRERKAIDFLTRRGFPSGLATAAARFRERD